MTKVEIRSWIEENPLRQFRNKNGLTLMDAAGLLGVGMSTVQVWEKGASTPKDDKLERLAELLGEPKIEKTWETWLQSRPKWTN